MFTTTIILIDKLLLSTTAVIKHCATCHPPPRCFKPTTVQVRVEDNSAALSHTRCHNNIQVIKTQAKDNTIYACVATEEEDSLLLPRSTWYKNIFQKQLQSRGPSTTKVLDYCTVSIQQQHAPLLILPLPYAPSLGLH